MFERYTEQCKTALYFARQAALRDSATAIDSGHLLFGLLTEEENRANTIFQLRERLPEDTKRQTYLANASTVGAAISLTDDGKRTLAFATREADQMKDYWIDTEHLVLGILRERENSTTAKLRASGLELNTSRHLVIKNRDTRPLRPNPVLWWADGRPSHAALAAFLIGILTALILLGLGWSR